MGKDLLASEFTNMDELRLIELKLQVGKPSEQVHDDQPLGFRFTTADGKRIVQMRKDGFTYNQLTPYTTGDDLRRTAFAHWNAYVRVARPEAVVRVAFRYINRIPLPAGQDFNRFLEAPLLPLSDPDLAIQAIHQRSVHDDAQTNARAILQIAVEPDVSTSKQMMTVDVDVFREGNFGCGEGELNAVLADLRALKNRVFFGTVSEELVEELV